MFRTLPSNWGEAVRTESITFIQRSRSKQKMLRPRMYCLLVFLTLQLAAQTFAQSQMSIIEAFEDSNCLERHGNMVPNSITFDASKPLCTLVRDDSSIPIVRQFDVEFYSSAESCANGIPIVYNYSESSYPHWPVTPLPVFPSPFSNHNMTFCFYRLQYGSASSDSHSSGPQPPPPKTNLILRDKYYANHARSKQGLAGPYDLEFLCELNPGADVFDPGFYIQSRESTSTQIYSRGFVQYPASGPIKYGLPMFIKNESASVRYQDFQICAPDTCCSTGAGPTTIHFKVPGSGVQFKEPTKAYAKVLSCSSGNMMFQIFEDDKCTRGSNFPSVLRADGSCQKNPTSVDSDGKSNSYMFADYGYGAYFKGRCQSATGPTPVSGVSVSGFLDSKCTSPNVDISPSTVTCDSSQCCLIANRKDVKYLERGVAHFFASAADCENNSPLHPTDVDYQIVAKNAGRIPLNISGLGLWVPPTDYLLNVCVSKCFDRQRSQPDLPCSCQLYEFSSEQMGAVLPRKPTMMLCSSQRVDSQDFSPPTRYTGYFAQYLGDGKWSFAIRMFSDWSCTNEIYVDPAVQSGSMCATDTCCRFGNSVASFYYRIPSSKLLFSGNNDDKGDRYLGNSNYDNIYGRLLSCNGNVAMFYQFQDSACSSLHDLVPRALRADGSCSANPTSGYAIDSFYTATCSSPPQPLVSSVTVSAFDDDACQTPSKEPIHEVSCAINGCCLVRQTTDPGDDPDKSSGRYSAIYARALSCNSQVLLFNTYHDSKCTIANEFAPMALRADRSCQADQTGYTKFYRASCEMLPAPPSPPPPPPLPCPKDPQGNVCGGTEFGLCNSGASGSACICVQGKGFFNGQICVSQNALAAAIAAVNGTFVQQQQQATVLNNLYCSDPSLPVKCPRATWVASTKIDQCHTSMAACAASAAGFRTYLQTLANQCTGRTPVFDAVLLQCIPSEVPRTPAFSCPDGMKRCFDGSCDTTCTAIQAPACPIGSSGSYLCPGNQLMCAASLSECSQKQPWNGCPVNLLQCPKRPGTCVASLQDCASASGP
jgi:hypothetical protein